MFRKISEIIKHPLTGIVIGILITVIVFFAQQKEIEPRYAVSNSELIAEATADAPRLKLLWDDEEIKNVYSVRIAIWNGGREYLDNASISTTDPIRVMYSPGIEILYAEFIKTSRDGLSFTTTDLSDNGVKAIQVEIVDDEALEYKDGGVLKILYTGQGECEFTVTGRIKGSRPGFERMSWATIIPTRDWSNAVIILGAPVGLVGLVQKIKSFRNRKSTLKAILDILIPVMLLITGAVVAFYFVEGWLLSLKWVI